MKESRKERLLRSWDPSKDSEEFKQHLWKALEENIESCELSDEDLDLAAGGMDDQERKKGILDK